MTILPWRQFLEHLLGVVDIKNHYDCSARELTGEPCAMGGDTHAHSPIRT
jgi:hypothetical protein